MCDEAAEIPSHNTMPGRTFACIKLSVSSKASQAYSKAITNLFLDILGNFFLDGVFAHSQLCLFDVRDLK